MDPFINWVASYPRSGNTWVRALLLAYQQGDRFSLNHMEGIPGEPRPAYYRMLWPGKDEPTNLDWAHMRALALRTYYETRRTKEFVLKTHTANVALKGVHLIPRGYTNKAIYVLRDPRDVLCSCARYFNKSHEEMLRLMLEPGHVLTDKNETLQFASSYANNVSGWTREKEFPVFLVKYGELLRDPGLVLCGMLKFLGTKINLEAVKAAVNATGIGTFRAIENRQGFREKPPEVGTFFGKGAEGVWRDELTPALADKLLEGLGLTQDARNAA